MKYSPKTFMSQLALLVLVHANGDAALQQAGNLIARTTDNNIGSPTPAPCPTTLKVPQRLDCGGCYSTIYSNTDTKSVDCGGCKTLTTETQYNFLVGVCPVCIEGVQTRYNSTGTSTVTSCSVTPTPYQVAYSDDGNGDVPKA
ncbi:hypothetical protein Slin15195_G102070 [Septoria linicola]|uniref:Uncharacterized protein n=1 Tax=Septoria linicola TaxID=215465 RepID=A0A9Q9B0X7_9PEZI|nr:hypothetical protein Slin14017_G065070 [Septoria linicola]USW56888.1 hypothetical protein Slin15195_G102070 [Septoria linicola]